MHLGFKKLDFMNFFHKSSKSSAYNNFLGAWLVEHPYSTSQKKCQGCKHQNIKAFPREKFNANQ